MKNFGKQHCARHRRSRGFTWIELMMVAFVILVTTTISLPSFIQAYQHYQVDDAAARMANVIKFTRYEAIRRNAPVSFGIGVTAAATTVAWTDSNGNGATAGMAGGNAADATERQVAFSPNVTLFAAGNVPNTAGLILAAGVGPLIPLSNTI